MSSRTRAIAKRLLLAVFSLTVALVACEIVGTVYSAMRHPRLTITDASLGWKYKPTEDAVERRDVLDNVNLTFINSEGFRDREFSTAEDTLRIMVLGDSMTFGLEANQDEIYPSVLEERLRPRLGGRPVDVMNFGVTGYGTAQELLTLEAYSDRYPPDVVLLMFFEYNDFQNNSTTFANRFVPHFVLDGEELRLVDEPTAWQGVKNFLRDYSTIFYLLTNRWQMTRELLREQQQLTLEESIELTVRILDRVHRFTSERGTPFLLFYVRDPEKQPHGHRAVEAFAHERGIPFREVPLREEQRVGGRGHWNREGHAATASLVEESLLQEASVREAAGLDVNGAVGEVVENR